MIHLLVLDSPYDNNHAQTLDEAQISLNDGDSVHILYCDKTYTVCKFNPLGSKFTCCICRKYQQESKELIGDKVNHYNISSFLTDNDKQLISSINFEYSNFEDIKKLTYSELDIGWAALSTYIDHTRNLTPLCNSRFKNHFNKILESALIARFAFKNALEQIKPDKITFHNGRHHQTRPLLRLAQVQNIPFTAIDTITSNGTTRKDLFNNSLPHGIEYNHKRILNNWNNSSLNELEKIKKADSFFEQRMSGKLIGDKKIYTKNMGKGILPAEWNQNKINIGIFISSEDEFYALGGEWTKKMYPSQYEGVIEILKSFQNLPNYHFTLRIHPNLKKVKYSYHTKFLDLPKTYDNITVVPGDSNVNTYDLIKSSDKIISFGSSTGIEAVYLGTPSVLLGNCYYKNLNGTYNPTTHDEAVQIIQQKLDPKDKIAAYQFGFYILRENTPFIHFNPNHLPVEKSYLGYKKTIKSNFRDKNKNLIQTIIRQKIRYRIQDLPFYLPKKFGFNLVPHEEAKS